MKCKFNFIVLFSLTVFLFGACNKESELDNTLPTSASESFELVTKKWDFPSSSPYSSIELTKDTVFVVQKNDLRKSTDLDIVSGKFSISEDGKTITLLGFGKMVIKSISSNTINIEIILNNSSNSLLLGGAQSNDTQNVLAGSTWITGTLYDGGNVGFYLKVKFITSTYMEVWDCNYNGTSQLNTSMTYSYDEIKDLINENIFTPSPDGITRVYKKILPETTNPASASIIGTEWRTGTLIENNDGVIERFYLKMTVSNDVITIWDCYYDGTSKINNSFSYVQNGNIILSNGNEIAKIDQRAITVEPIPGVIRIYAKQ